MKGLRTTAAATCALMLTACGPKGIEPTSGPWQPPPAAAVAKPILERSPCENSDPNRQALFGDLHIHTGLSMDAYVGGSRTLPDDAYAFASGKAIDVYSGDPDVGDVPVQIDRPLDFAAVTDHAEWLAEVALCTTPGSPTYDSEGCGIYRGEGEALFTKLLGFKGFRARLGGVLGLFGRRSDVCGDDDEICRAELAKVWGEIQASAERWYDRSSACQFTTFHAWEYSHSPYGTKIHRNVILRNEISPELPLSSLEVPVEMDLRRQLVDLCNDTDSGCEAIAIPHNPNLSNGQLFKIEYAHLPEARQQEEAALRARLEPIVEMMQIKGESECRNGMYQVLGGEDELCGFEKIRDMGLQNPEDCEEEAGWGAQAGRGCTSRGDFVRYALIEGLREEQRIGVNPYAFGFIGSTDTHRAMPGDVAENRVPSKYGTTIETLLTVGEQSRPSAFQNPGGLAGVWAVENSRDAIFDALKRREAFATSGPRIKPRFFAGHELPEDLCERADMVATGYASGVAMGGVIQSDATTEDSPMFLVSAQGDPGTADLAGGLLQRLQIIKGWVDEEGMFQQRVIDVAGDADNGAGVDLETCRPFGPGEAALCGTWRDPEFDPGQDAVYYARAVENPSCRWSTHQCLALPPDQRPDGCANGVLPATVQERAWTSPIWYEGRASR